jgi:hypothetical protein
MTVILVHLFKATSAHRLVEGLLGSTRGVVDGSGFPAFLVALGAVEGAARTGAGLLVEGSLGLAVGAAGSGAGAAGWGDLDAFAEI